MRMSVSLGLGVPADPSGMDLADEVRAIATTAERVGFDAVYVTDHPIPHPAYVGHGGHHTFDPFVLLSFAAAATTTLRLQTHLVVLPYRNPFITAKQVASLDALSGGRVILGVGTGYMEQEFAALGVTFEERGALTSEAVVAMRTAWAGEPFDFEGRHFSARGNEAHPRPAQRPNLPIWIGGNSQPAIRRAVELGDGWIPFPHRPAYDDVPERHSDPIATLDDLEPLIAYAREHAESIGRTTPLDIVFMPGAAAFLDQRAASSEEIIDACGRLAAMGVTYLMAGVGGRDRAEHLDALERYATDVLPTVQKL